MRCGLKKIIIAQLFVCLSLVSCHVPNVFGKHDAPNPKEAKLDNPPMIGGDKDEHGCFISAGYSWSPTRKQCLRVWEAGIRLSDLSALDSPISIILIENGDNKPLELYLPQFSKPLVFEKNGDEWLDEKEEYLIKKENNHFQVYDKNDKLVAKN